MAPASLNVLLAVSHLLYDGSKVEIAAPKKT